jgi:HAD superfamily hydrolase (TIGR01549 family)
MTAESRRGWNGEVLLIDLDGTLIDSPHGAVGALQQLDREATDRGLIKAGRLMREVELGLTRAWQQEPVADDLRRLGCVMTDGLWGGFEGTGGPLPDLSSWALDFRQRFWIDVCVRCGIDDRSVAEYLVTQYPLERRARIASLKGVSETLRQLAVSYRLVLFSNGASDLQRLKLSTAGLEGPFARIVISGELGAAKPSPQAFNAALQIAGCGPGDALMIGDDWTNDVMGARAVGMRAIHLEGPVNSRNDRRASDPVEGVYRVDSFSAVPEQLRALT